MKNPEQLHRLYDLFSEKWTLRNLRVLPYTPNNAFEADGSAAAQLQRYTAQTERLMAAINRDEITSVLASLTDAWGQHDAEAYGKLFTDDATYITFVGTVYRGRRDIVESHRVLFTKFLKGTQLADEITDIRFFGADTAIVVSRGDTFKGKRPQTLSKVQTYTLVREEDGHWRIAAFHNTKHKRLLEAITFKFAPGTMPAVGAV